MIASLSGKLEAWAAIGLLSMSGASVSKFIYRLRRQQAGGIGSA